MERNHTIGIMRDITIFFKLIVVFRNSSLKTNMMIKSLWSHFPIKILLIQVKYHLVMI